VLAFIGNLSFSETLLIAVVAVLIVGRRLPEVAAQAMVQLRKLRRMADDVRRETGIDRELRNVRQQFRDVEREARIEPSLQLPSGPRAPRVASPGAPPPSPAPAPPPAPAAQDEPAAPAPGASKPASGDPAAPPTRPA
jgi:Sec-independent protein translocase protein TatA